MADEREELHVRNCTLGNLSASASDGVLEALNRVFGVVLPIGVDVVVAAVLIVHTQIIIEL